MNDILGILIDAGYLQSQFDAHPRDMWAYTMLVFMVGVGIGFGVGLGIGAAVGTGVGSTVGTAVGF